MSSIANNQTQTKQKRKRKSDGIAPLNNLSSPLNSNSNSNSNLIPIDAHSPQNAALIAMITSPNDGKRSLDESCVDDENNIGDGEDDDGKRQKRRLVKNREAAQLFRQRQKAYITDLETKVTALSTENADFKAKVELLRSENKLIKDQLAYLRNFISQAISLSLPFTSTQVQPPLNVNGISLSNQQLLQIPNDILVVNQNGVENSTNSNSVDNEVTGNNSLINDPQDLEKKIKM